LIAKTVVEGGAAHSARPTTATRQRCRIGQRNRPRSIKAATTTTAAAACAGHRGRNRLLATCLTRLTCAAPLATGKGICGIRRKSAVATNTAARPATTATAATAEIRIGAVATGIADESGGSGATGQNNGTHAGPAVAVGGERGRRRHRKTKRRGNEGRTDLAEGYDNC
jgi:hypothetical protein